MNALERRIGWFMMSGSAEILAYGTAVRVEQE